MIDQSRQDDYYSAMIECEALKAFARRQVEVEDITPEGLVYSIQSFIGKILIIEAFDGSLSIEY